VFAAATFPRTFPAEIRACSGQDVSIFCQYSDQQNDTSIYTDWHFDREEIKRRLSNEGQPLIGLEEHKYDVSDNGTVTALIIHKANTNDTGNYSCIVLHENDCYSTVPVTVGKRIKCSLPQTPQVVIADAWVE